MENDQLFQEICRDFKDEALAEVGIIDPTLKVHDLESSFSFCEKFITLVHRSTTGWSTAEAQKFCVVCFEAADTLGRELAEKAQTSTIKTRSVNLTIWIRAMDMLALLPPATMAIAARHLVSSAFAREVEKHRHKILANEIVDFILEDADDDESGHMAGALVRNIIEASASI